MLSWRTNHDGTIPVDCNKGPRKRHGDHWSVDEARMSRVAEVQAAQVEEVDDQDQFGPDKVGANKEHDEAELQEIVDNEMASDTGSCVDIFGVLGEEVTNVSHLEDESNKPISISIYMTSFGDHLYVPIN